MKHTKIRWVIAHEPAYLFYRVAEDFKRIVSELGKGLNIDIEILTAEEFNDQYKPTESASRHNLWRFLQDNTVQIAQMQTTSLARQFNKQMHVLDMPYLFEDHDHAAEVLEGSVGDYLLNNFDQESKLKGLAYTYSGGFRVMPLNHTVTSLGEIIGLPIRSGLAPQAIDTIAALGATPVPADLEQTLDIVRAGQVAGAEYVTQRIFPDQCDEWIKTVIETNHSLFLTSIVVNVDWWNNLEADVQSVFLAAAKEAARNERALSIKDGESSLQKLKDKGVSVLQLSADELADVKAKTQSVYDKYNSGYFDSGLIEQIQKH
jgi:TRAP-type C4-dicarboxylate transport system substrate-binding protein